MLTERAELLAPQVREFELLLVQLVLIGLNYLPELNARDHVAVKSPLGDRGFVEWGS